MTRARDEERFREIEYEQGRRQQTLDAATWSALLTHNAAMRPLSNVSLDPRPPLDWQKDGQAVVVGAASHPKIAVDAWTPDPEPHGWVAGVEVRSRTGFSGSLLLPLHSVRLGRLHPGSLLVFRFAEERAGWIAVALSGIGGAGTYVWARITGPGRYGVLGLDCDPVYLQILATLISMRGLLVGMERQERQELAAGIVARFLDAVEVRRWLAGDDSIGDFGAGVAELGLPRLPVDGEFARVEQGVLEDLALRIADDPEPPEVRLFESSAQGVSAR